MTLCLMTTISISSPIPRDLLMHDFMTVETSQFPSKGGHQVGPATGCCTALLLHCYSSSCVVLVLVWADPSAANDIQLWSSDEFTILLWSHTVAHLIQVSLVNQSKGPAWVKCGFYNTLNCVLFPSDGERGGFWSCDLCGVLGQFLCGESSNISLFCLLLLLLPEELDSLEETTPIIHIT